MSHAEKLETAINALIDLVTKSGLLVQILKNAASVPETHVGEEMREANRVLGEWWASWSKARDSIYEVHVVTDSKADAPAERWTVRVGVILDELQAPIHYTNPELANPGKLHVPVFKPFNMAALDKLDTTIRTLRQMRDNPDRPAELTQAEYARLSGLDTVAVNRMVKDRGEAILTIKNARDDRAAAGKEKQRAGATATNMLTGKAKRAFRFRCRKCEYEWEDGYQPKKCPVDGGEVIPA